MNIDKIKYQYLFGGNKMKYSHIYKSSCYCITLCRAENALTAFYDNQLKSIGITIKQFCLLDNLDKLQEASTSELAQKVNLERSTITRNLQLLITKGWIYDKSKTGQRAHKYSLTDEGIEILKKASELWKSTQQKTEDIIGKEKLDDFMDILCKLQTLNLEEESC